MSTKRKIKSLQTYLPRHRSPKQPQQNRFDAKISRKRGGHKIRSEVFYLHQQKQRTIVTHNYVFLSIDKQKRAGHKMSVFTKQEHAQFVLSMSLQKSKSAEVTKLTLRALGIHVGFKSDRHTPTCCHKFSIVIQFLF